MPKVSVIVPVYNVETYLKKCVDSILNQTFTDFECILIDDGSLDKSLEICEEYAKCDSRIKVIHKKNSGVSEARNIGLNSATGQYIIFVDSDDYIADNTLAVLVKRMEYEPVDIIAYNYTTVDEQDKILWNRGYNEAVYDIKNEQAWLEFVVTDVLSNNIGWEIWNKMFVTAIIKEYDIRFNSDFKIGEDLDFVLRYLLHCKRMLTLPENFYFYVIHDNSAMRKLSESKINDFVELNKNLYKILKRDKKSLLLRKYYLIFYMLMNIRYMPTGFDEIIRDIGRISDKRFYRSNVIKVLMHADEVYRHQDRTSKINIIVEHLYYLAYSSNKLVKNSILMILKRKRR